MDQGFGAGSVFNYSDTEHVAPNSMYNSELISRYRDGERAGEIVRMRW